LGGIIPGVDPSNAAIRTCDDWPLIAFSAAPVTAKRIASSR